MTSPTTMRLMGLLVIVIATFCGCRARLLLDPPSSPRSALDDPTAVFADVATVLRTRRMIEQSLVIAQDVRPGEARAAATNRSLLAEEVLSEVFRDEGVGPHATVRWLRVRLFRSSSGRTLLGAGSPCAGIAVGVTDTASGEAFEWVGYGFRGASGIELEMFHRSPEHPK